MCYALVYNYHHPIITLKLVLPQTVAWNSPAYKVGGEFAENAGPGAASLAVPMGEGGGCWGSVVRGGVLVSCGSLLTGVESASARHPSREVGAVCYRGAAYVVG